MKYNFEGIKQSIEARAIHIMDVYQERVLEDNLKNIKLNKDIHAIAFNKSELEFLYEEIFQSKTYLYNISINDGDIIFDVGANIGMSSIFFAKQADDLKIYSFEPIDRLHTVLDMNLFIHSHEASFKTFNCGLGKENQENIPFAFFKNNTLISTRYPNKKEDSQLLSTFLENSSESNSNEQIIDFVIESQREVFCQIRTISSIIQQEKIERINLLKIDVEKAELDVLKGIEKQDWRKIDQIIVEVHNTKNKLSRIKSLLSEKEYVIKVLQEKKLKGTGLYVVYAAQKPVETNYKAKKMII